MNRLKELLAEDIEEEAGGQSLADALEAEEENKDHEFIEVISYSIEEGLETASRRC